MGLMMDGKFWFDYMSVKVAYTKFHGKKVFS